jgi:hypothetical protein
MIEINKMRSLSLTSPDKKNSVAVGNFDTDFFALAHGVIQETAGVSASLAVDTSVWGYRTIRTRQYYWVDKMKLMKRIVRSTNISLWQKKREHGCEKGTAAEAVFSIIATRAMWIGVLGNGSAYERRGGGERRIVGVANKDSSETTMLGTNRYDWKAIFGQIPFEHGDSVVLSVGSAAVQPYDVYEALLNIPLADDHWSDRSREILSAVTKPDSPWGICVVERN